MPELTGPDGTSLWYGLHPSTAPVAHGTDRPLVVVCPPGGRNAAYWPTRLLEGLDTLGADVVRPDWRGQGRSAWDVGPVTIDQLVADLLGVIGAVAGEGRGGARPLTLVGVGLGGRVAAQAAQQLVAAGRTPEHLALVGSSAYYSDPTLPGPTEPIVVSLVLRRRGGGPTELARALAREIAVEAARPGPVDGSAFITAARAWIDHGYNPEDGHRVAWLAAPGLERARVPLARRVTVLHGAADPVVPAAHGARLAELTGGTLVEVPDTGHHLDDTMVEHLLVALGPRP